MPKEPDTHERLLQPDFEVPNIPTTGDEVSPATDDASDRQSSQYVRLGRVGVFGPSLDGDFYL